MPQIETIIKCNNCDFDHGQSYINQIPELSIDDILDPFYECNDQTCGLEICERCKNTCYNCNELFCNDCYNNDKSVCNNCVKEIEE